MFHNQFASNRTEIFHFVNTLHTVSSCKHINTKNRIIKIKPKSKLNSKQMATQQSSKLKTKAEKLIGQYEQRLRDIKSIDINEIGLEGVAELCDGFELEMNTLNSKKAAILSEETRATIKDLYLMITLQYRYIVSVTRSINDIIRPRLELVATEDIGIKLTKANQVFEKLQLNKSISESIKQTLLKKFNSQMQEITNFFINNYFPVEFRDSIFLIESTLAEPELYSLPSLIMWRETAKGKISKIQLIKKNDVIPEIIKVNITNKYKSLVKQLQAEILKLRTYPIPEPWCSYTMRQGLTHVIEGEFIFFVHPGIEEDMRPLNLSDRDLLPGGISRLEYDTRLNRVNTETALAIGKLEDNNASHMERLLEWFENSYMRIEEGVNFAFTELSDSHRDARSLEYLVDKNQDDELLKEIYNMVLRQIRHYFNNRIDIPSVAIDIINNPILTAPPMAERNIPTASGIDRGGDSRINLVAPSSVVVVMKTVIVADGYGHRVSRYRTRDLWCMGSSYNDKYDTPVSLTYFKGSVYVAYRDVLLPFTLTWKDSEITLIDPTVPGIAIPEISCTANNENNLYVGTLTPSLLLINTDTNSVEREYPLQAIRYPASHKKGSRYPWLQDMKAANDLIVCLFTGSPSPLQLFSFEGELIRSVIREDQITEAYHFAVYFNAVTGELRFYISDFWDNAIKVFDTEGMYIENICEEGTGLCQISRPTGLFIEETGYITYCDMKENNCLQRL